MRHPLLAALFLTTLGGWLHAAPPLVVLLLGPPGGGKGTQAEFITRDFLIPAISTGDLLRAEVKAGTPLGKQVAETMARGELVGDAIVDGLIEKRTAQPDAAGGFLLDGYPRTRAQAVFLDGLVKRRGYPPPLVLLLEVPDAVVIDRLSRRGRPDDKPEVVRDRLRVYHQQTQPVIEYYGGRCRPVDGTGSPEDVYRQIRELLRAASPR